MMDTATTYPFPSQLSSFQNKKHTKTLKGITSACDARNEKIFLLVNFLCRI